MKYEGPAYANMLGGSLRGDIEKQLARNARIIGARADECVIRKMAPVRSWEVAHTQGYRTRYQLHWTTYRGWRVYMLQAGRFASDPKLDAIRASLRNFLFVATKRELETELRISLEKDDWFRAECVRELIAERD